MSKGRGGFSKPAPCDKRAGSLPMMTIVVMIIIVVVIVTMATIVNAKTPKEVSKGPLGHVPALLPRFGVREAEMNSVVDADIDRINSHV